MGSTCGRWSVATLAALFALSTGVVFGAVKSEHQKIKTGTITGTVADSAGKALADVSVKLNSNGKEVQSVKTDAKGAFTLKDVTAGKYELVVPNASPLKLIADPDADTKELKIVVPQAKGSAALETTTWVWIGVGAVAATAVATPVVVNNPEIYGGSRDTKVSP